MQAKSTRELFDAAMQLPSDARQGWLDAQMLDEPTARRLAELIAAVDDETSVLDRPFAEHMHSLAQPQNMSQISELIGTEIDGYRLVSLLGQGGMASVFAAERVGADFEQLVAIKLLRRTLHTDLELRLFQRERQALASLEHPNIARLLDGGVTDAGVPYLVMELIRGSDLLTHARQNNLSLRARLALFAQVCDAVNAAHRALIVHRDIKPGNILVNENGQAKLLDFGIAKLLDTEQANQPTTFAPLTPEYAAPEQFDGRAITTATDVYGLGVVLHELLLGTRPKRGDTTRASDLTTLKSTTAQPATPITQGELRRFLRGDIDNILRQSLSAEPNERYASAGDLAADLRRFLDGQPVQAHPPSGWYRTKKFVRRNVGAVLVCSALLLGLVGATGIALNQAQQARAESARANAVRDFMVGLFESAQGRLPRDARATPEQLVAEAERKLKADTTLDNATRAEILQSLAEVSLTTAQYPAAVRTLSEAAELLAPEDPRRLRIVVLWAGALDRTGETKKALALIEPLQQQLAQAPTETAMEGFEVLMNIHASLGNTERSIAAARESASIAEVAYGADGLLALKGRLTLGNALSFFQKYDEALPLLDQTITSWKAQGYPMENLYFDALGSQAAGYASSGQAGRGEQAFAELLTAQRTVHQPPHDDLAHTMRNLGVLMARNGKTVEGIAMLTESLAMMRAVLGDKDQQVVMSYVQLGASLFAVNALDDAQKNYAAAQAICEGERLSVVACARTHQGLGQIATRRQQWPVAGAQLALAERLYRTLYGDEHSNIAAILSIQATLAVDMGHADEALRLARQSLALWDSLGLQKNRERILAQAVYAKALWRSGDASAALAELELAIVLWQIVEPNDLVRNTIMLSQKAQYLRTLGRLDEARTTARQAITVGTPAAQLSPETIATLREIDEAPAAFQ